MQLPTAAIKAGCPISRMLIATSTHSGRDVKKEVSFPFVHFPEAPTQPSRAPLGISGPGWRHPSLIAYQRAGRIAAQIQWPSRASY